MDIYLEWNTMRHSWNNSVYMDLRQASRLFRPFTLSYYTNWTWLIKDIPLHTRTNHAQTYWHL